MSLSLPEVSIILCSICRIAILVLFQCRLVTR